MNEAEIRTRLAELRAKQEAATSWGAAVGARQEEIKELEGRLSSLTVSLPDTGPSVPPADLADRIRLYLDDLPADGMHSDAAGANVWELLEEAMHELKSGPAQCAGLTAEDVYANCETTLIGFQHELTERDRKFICDQISRKVIASNADTSTDTTSRPGPEVVAAVQEAIMKHPFWKPGLGSSGFAFGLANTAIDAYLNAVSQAVRGR